MMNVRPTQSKQAQAGFTLVELSIVLGVMTVLAVNFTPSFIAAQREGLAEQTVETYYRLADAAVAYRANNDNWPGIDPESGNCAMLSGGNGPGGMHNPPAFGDNTFGHAADETNMALKKLAEAGYIPSEDVRNPWDGDFILRGVCLDGDGIDGCESCGLDIISQAIPSTVGKMVSNLLPLAEEPDDSGNVQDITMRVNPDALGGGDGGGGGGEMPSGAIMMSEQDCPEGWSEYNMAGRMPVGVGDMHYVQGENEWDRHFDLGEEGADTIQLSGKTNGGLLDYLQYATPDGGVSYYDYVNDGGDHAGGAFEGIFSWMGLDVNENDTNSLLPCIPGRNCIEGLKAEEDHAEQEQVAIQRTGGKQVYSPYKVLNFCQKI